MLLEGLKERHDNWNNTTTKVGDLFVRAVNCTEIS
jgi:hypothetical protein